MGRHTNSTTPKPVTQVTKENLKFTNLRMLVYNQRIEINQRPWFQTFLFFYGFPNRVTLNWYSIARLYELAIY